MKKDAHHAQTLSPQSHGSAAWKLPRKIENGQRQPSIEAAKKLAGILDTTVGYVLGETEESDFFKDKKILQRLQDIMKLPEKERSSILLTLDHFIKASKINLI